MKNFSTIAAIFTLITLASNAYATKPHHYHNVTYRDIPGITEEDIRAIAEIRANRGEIVFANHVLNESFRLPSGEPVGDVANFFNFFSSFFNIKFVSIHDDDDEGDTTASYNIDTCRADIVYGVVNTPSVAARYHMTTPIAGHNLFLYATVDAPTIRRMNDIDGTRVGYLKGSATAEMIERYYPNLNAEMIAVSTLSAAAEKLGNGQIDFFMSGLGDRYLTSYGNIKQVSTLAPLYVPISIATSDSSLHRLINIFDRYLNSANGLENLANLYSAGRTDFLRAKLNSMLTDEERQYIDSVLANGGEVSVGFMHDAYPASFFNRVENEYQGIAPEILREVTNLTDIRFVETHTNNTTPLAEIVGRVRNGDISMATHIIFTESRRHDFLWNEVPYLSSRFALLSRIDFEQLEMFKVYYHRVGIVGGSVHAERFEQWFPGHRHTVTYATGAALFDALEHNEIDLAMLAENMLWAMTNYYGNTGFRVNIAFNEMQDANFGYNREEIHLRSIMDKAMSLIDIEGIRDYWVNRSFDYSSEILRQRLHYMSLFMGIVTLLLFVMIFMFLKNQKLSKNLQLESAKHKNAELRAAEASKEKSRFLANMSHEIRTPLNAIVGMADLLSTESMTERQKSYVKDICVASHALLSIVNDVLDISKIEAGKLELCPENYNLHSFVENIVSLFKFMAQKKGLHFNSACDFNTLPKCVYGDDVRLRQALLNLCANAVNYTSVGGVGFKVVAASDNILRFEVSDTGCGIKEDAFDKIFQPFRRFDKEKNRGVQGSGLGLPITKKFIDLMGGDITFTSVYGKGSTFCITIPFTVGDESKIKRIDSAVGEKVRVKAVGARVLVVDDNYMNLKVAFRLLGLFNILPVLVGSGREAIAEVQKNEYDIVFMDHMMPDIDGIEATAKIRELGGKFETLPIIALTANATYGIRDTFIEAGMNDYLSKPIELGSLNETLKTWLPASKVSETQGLAAPPEIAAGLAIMTDHAGSGKDFWAAVSKIEYINAEVGKNRVAGIEEMYREMLELLREKLSVDCARLEELLLENDLHNFSILVHGLKSSLATVGATGLAQTAYELEGASKEGNDAFCRARLPAFLDNLHDLVFKIVELLSGGGNGNAPQDTELKPGNVTILREHIAAALDAIDLYNGDAAIAVLDDLLGYDFDSGVIAVLKKARNALKNFEFSEAVDLLKEVEL